MIATFRSGTFRTCLAPYLWNTWPKSAKINPTSPKVSMLKFVEVSFAFGFELSPPTQQQDVYLRSACSGSTLAQVQLMHAQHWLRTLGRSKQAGIPPLALFGLGSSANVDHAQAEPEHAWSHVEPEHADLEYKSGTYRHTIVDPCCTTTNSNGTTTSLVMHPTVC